MARLFIPSLSLSGTNHQLSGLRAPHSPRFTCLCKHWQWRRGRIVASQRRERRTCAPPAPSSSRGGGCGTLRDEPGRGGRGHAAVKKLPSLLYGPCLKHAWRRRSGSGYGPCKLMERRTCFGQYFGWLIAFVMSKVNCCHGRMYIGALIDVLSYSYHYWSKFNEQHSVPY